MDKLQLWIILLTLCSVICIAQGHTRYSAQAQLCLNERNASKTTSRSDYDECVFDHNQRYDCGFAGITAEECIEKGCCHNSSVNGTIAPHCFYPLAEECSQVERFDCGYNGMDVHECQAKGCCWDSKSGQEGPNCFFKQLSGFCVTAECSFPATERYDCGYPGISVEECLGRNCCHDNTIPDVPHCFFKQRSACEVPNEEKRDCGYVGISQEECLDRECCHIAVSGYPTCYPTLYDPFTKFKSLGQADHDIWFLTHRTMITFTVRACKNAFVHLRQTAYSEKDMYKLHFGHDSSHDIRIEKYVDGSLQGESQKASVPDILHCDESRSFYVEWTGTKVLVGYRSTEYLLEYIDTDPLTVVEVKMYTLDVEGYWTFNNNMGRSSNVAQQTSTSYDQLWMEVRPTVTNMVFAIWADEYAYLLLAENFENRQIAFEICFGSVDNQETYVLDLTTEIRETVYTPDILKGKLTPVTIWISWESHHIQMGYGEQIGQDIFFTKIFSDSRVNAVRFISTGHKSADENDYAYFTFRYLTDQLYYFRTPPQPEDPNDAGHFVKRVHMATHKPFVLFRVAACKSAHVYLADHSNRYRVEAIIGAYYNQRTILTEYKESTVVQRSTPEILSCNHGTNFWMSWKDNYVSLGRGSVVGEHTLVKLYDLHLPNDIVGIGFRTSETWGEWEVPDNEVTSAIVQPVASSSYERTDFWRDVSTREHSYVRVKACEEVHVLFTVEPGVLDDTRTVVVGLGVQGNTDNFIKDGLHGNILDQYTKPNMLSCHAWYWFWFSWDGDSFNVGSGGHVGNNMFLSASWESFSSQIKIRSMGVAVSSSNQSILEFHQPVGELYTFFSKSSQDRELMLITEKQYFNFEVQACFDARVILLQNPNDATENAYHIFFGTVDNKHIQIKRGSVTLMSVTQDEVVNCEEMRAFWITWHDKQIYIGRSAVVGEGLILQYIPDSPADFTVPLNAIKLETYDSSQDGRWVVSSDVALSSQLVTESGVGYLKFWLGVEDSTSIVFTLRSPVEGWLALSETSGATVGLYNTREVILKDTTQIREKDDGANPVLAEADTPGILSDEEDHYFWLSWANGLLQVGTGSMVGVDAFIVHQEATPFAFTTLAVSGGSQGEAKWVFPNAKQTFAEIQTHALVFTEFRYKNIAPEIRFSIQACKSAHIALLSGEDHGGAHSKLYELVIGGKDNTVTYIQRSDQIDWESEQEIATPEILHCYEERSFTFSWGVGGFTFLGEDGLFFSWTDPEYQAVEFLSFGTEYITGYWYIVRTAGDQFYTQTYDGENQITSHKEVPTNHDEEARPIKNNNAKGHRHNSDDQNKQYKNTDTKKDASSIDFENEKARIQNNRNTKEENHNSEINQNKHYKDTYTTKDAPSSPYFEYIPGIYKYYSLWLSVAGTEYTWFMVRACSEAHVVVSKYYGISDFDSYEIRMGEHNNQYINIYADRETQCSSDLHEDLLDCEVYLTFWVRWRGNLLEIGQGHVPGTQLLASCQTQDTLDIRGISFASAGGQRGEWIFEDVTGSEVTSFWTHNEYPNWGYNSTWVTPRQDWISFEVQTKEWVTLALCYTPRDVSTQCYEVHIGKQDTIDPKKQISYINDIDHPESPIVSVTTPNAITNGALNTFWVSWQGGMIAVGYGNQVNEGDAFMKTHEPRMPSLPVNGIGFATPRADSRWQIPRDLARAVQVKLKDSGPMYNDFEVALRGLFSMVFQVKASGAVLIALETDNGGLPYVIEIGIDDNKYTRLIGYLGEEVVKKSTQNILNSEVEQTYWIAWDAKNLHFGRGGQLERDAVFEYTDEDSVGFSFKKALCSAEQDAQATWYILEMLGMTYNFMTPEVHGYDVAWMYVSYHTSLEFRVQACNDAHILLSQVEGLNEYNGVYEIVLGSSANTKLRIRKNAHHADMEVVDYEGVLDCNALKQFWVSWTDGRITVGSGYLESGFELITWQDPDPLQIQYAAVSTGWGAAGEWELMHTQSEHLSLETKASEAEAYNTSYIVIQGHDYIRFEVQACKEAHVALMQIPATPDVFMYEIALGHQEGKGVALRHEVDGSIVQQAVSDTQVLDCDSKKEFWLSWSNTEGIRMGQSLHSNEAELASFSAIPGQLSRINAVAFRTGHGDHGYWTYHGSGRMYSYPGVPDDTSGGSLSGGEIFLIILGVLLGTTLIAFLVLIAVHPPSRLKAQQTWITVSSKFTTRSDPIDTQVFANEVGFGEEHNA